MLLPDWFQWATALVGFSIAVVTLFGLLRKVVRTAVTNIVAQPLSDIEKHLERQDTKVKVIERRFTRHEARIHKRVDDIQKELKTHGRQGI